MKTKELICGSLFVLLGLIFVLVISFAVANGVDLLMGW